MKKKKDWEEVILKICYGAFWSVFALWCLAVLAKVIITFT